MLQKQIIPIIIIAVLLITGAGVLFFIKKDSASETVDNNYVIKNVGLLLNTDKNRYDLKDQVYFQIASLDQENISDCESNLELTIAGPDDFNLKLSTGESSINPTPDCGTQNSPNNPDYTAFFEPEKEGVYGLKLTNLNNKEFIESSLIVGNIESDITLTRWGASKIIADEDKRYPMKFTIVSASDFKGELVEVIPSGIEVVWQGPAHLEEKDNYKTLTWDIELSSGKEKEFSYEYIATEQLTGIVGLGKARIIKDNNTVREETNPWTIIVTKN